jgi:hypothetical protein
MTTLWGLNLKGISVEGSTAWAASSEGRRGREKERGRREGGREAEKETEVGKERNCEWEDNDNGS